MNLNVMTFGRTPDSIEMAFTLLPEGMLANSDDGTEVVFQGGLHDIFGESPDFVVPVEDIIGAAICNTVEFADEVGMVLRLQSHNLDEATDKVAAFVAKRYEEATGQPVTIVHR